MIEKTLSNGQTAKAYPISNSQKMMFLMSLKYGSGYPVNNIGCGYYWQGELNVDVMKESIYEAIERCDTMRLRFTMEKNSTFISMLLKRVSSLLRNGITVN